MKKDALGLRSFVVLAAGLALLALAACVPAAESAAAEAVPRAIPLDPELQEWSAEIMGIGVQYRIVDEFEEHIRWAPEEMNVPAVASSNPEAGDCRIDLHTSFVAGEYRDVQNLAGADVRSAQARSLASLVHSCLVELLIDPEAEIEREESGYPIFTRSWAEVYVEDCGGLLQPLGVPAADGECELPDLHSLLVPLGDA